MADSNKKPRLGSIPKGLELTVDNPSNKLLIELMTSSPEPLDDGYYYVSHEGERNIVIVISEIVAVHGTLPHTTTQLDRIVLTPDGQRNTVREFGGYNWQFIRSATPSEAS